MTTNLNAGSIDFTTVARNNVATNKPQADIQINHAAIAACLCALVLIGILLLPTISSTFSSANTIENVSTDSGYTAFIE